MDNGMMIIKQLELKTLYQDQLIQSTLWLVKLLNIINFSPYQFMQKNNQLNLVIKLINILKVKDFHAQLDVQVMVFVILLLELAIVM